MPASRSPAIRGRRRRVALVVAGVLGVFLAWEVLTSFVAYTDDAYVRSDVVAVSPQVTGHIVAVRARDNQTVRHGDPLVSIEAVPFQLAVDERQAAMREAEARRGGS